MTNAGDALSIGTGGWLTTPSGGSGEGTAQLTVTPSQATAAVTVEGPLDYSASGTGTQVLTSLDAGIYRITWGAVSGYSTPTVSYVDVPDGGTESVTGTYDETRESDPLLMRDAICALLAADGNTSSWTIEKSTKKPSYAKFALNGHVQVSPESEAEANNEWSGEGNGYVENTIACRIQIYAKHADPVEEENLIANRVAMVKQALRNQRNNLGEDDPMSGSVTFGRVNYLNTTDEDGFDISAAVLTVSAVYMTDPTSRYRA